MVVAAPNWVASPMEIGEKTGMQRVFHWGTGFAYFLITWIGSVTTFFTIQLLPIDTLSGFVNFIVFLTWNFLTLVNLYTASYVGPGYVIRKWVPSKNSHKNELQFCNICEGYKVPRSHHCSKCNRCCMKMDHHCPWINNCVGHRNHAYFCKFLFFAIVGCFHAAVIDAYSLYYALFRGHYELYGDGSHPIIYITVWSFLALIIAFAFATAVVLGLSLLLFTQIRYVIKNMNGIEEYIHGKALNLRKKTEKKSGNETTEAEEEEEAELLAMLGEWNYPYDLGWKTNFRQVFPSWISGETVGNGTWWPVKDGCNQFTFTNEQLLQKQSKKERSRVLVIRDDFEGKYCSARKYGWKICFRQPLIDGKCLKVNQGDVFIATRGIQGWAFGFVEDKPANKGWVPILCTNLAHKKSTKEEETKKTD